MYERYNVTHIVMLPWQQFSFQVSFLRERHSPFLAFTNIVHSLMVNEETKDNNVCVVNRSFFLLLYSDKKLEYLWNESRYYKTVNIISSSL